MSNGNGPGPAPHASQAQATIIKPTDLRGILKYVPRFQGQIFIIAIDGSIVDDENFGNLLVDIAVLRSLGIKVVLVHGISQQLQDLAALRGIAISNADGTGPTDAATLDLSIRSSSRVSHVILEGLTQNSLKAVITNAVRALPVGIIKGVDQQLTGKVERIDKELIIELIAQQVVPLVSPLAFGPDGKSLRVNSDLLAAELAEVLGATKIIFLTPHTGLEIEGEVRREIAVDALRALLANHPEQISEASRSKAVHAIKAIETGTPRVHILDGRVFDGLLNEIFSNEGVGSLVYGNDYQQIRKAAKRDVRLIYNLTRNAVRREELIYRTQQADREEHRPVLRFRDRREHHRLRHAHLLCGEARGGRGRLPLRHALLPQPGHRQEDGRLRMPPGQGTGRDDGDRPVDPEFRILHQRLRLRGDRQGEPPGGPAKAVRGKRPQRQGAPQAPRLMDAG